MRTTEWNETDMGRVPASGTALAPPQKAIDPRSGIAARILALLRDEEGAATAEYAVATMAAVGFAGLLVVILRGDEVRGILTDLIRRALTIAG